MIGYLLIALHTLLNLGESVVVRTYARRHGSGGFIMNAITTLFASLFFLATDKGGFYLPPALLPLVLINALLLGAGFYFTFDAFQCGPYGLTRLFSGFTLVITVVYGIIAFKEPATVLTFLGIAMILAAMALINYQKGGDGAQKGFSLKWLLCVTVSLVANGGIAILTRVQQIRFENACSNEFQFVSFGIAFVLLAIIGLIADRDKLGYVLKAGSLYGIATGILNGAKNFVTLIIYLYLPFSIISPLQNGFGMVATFVVALLCYKEKYSKKQLLGVILGTAAIILLAL